jgi:hypothetical protein
MNKGFPSAQHLIFRNTDFKTYFFVFSLNISRTIGLIVQTVHEFGFSVSNYRDTVTKNVDIICFPSNCCSEELIL